MVEAHIVSYTATAECIEDWTERNLHRDRFTDETTVCKRSVINQSNNNNDIIAILWQKNKFSQGERHHHSSYD